MLTSVQNPGEGFQAHLARLPAEAGRHVEDVRLAWDAAHGDAAAQEALEASAVEPARAKLARRFGAALVDEALQRVRERLLLGRALGGPGLLAYQGRGTLKAWTYAVALRAVQDLLRADRRGAAAGDVEDAAAVLASADPELALIQGRYAREVNAAIRGALEGLPRRERVLLRMSVVSGLSVDQLARVYHVHRTTAARWISEAKRQVLEQTLASLRESLKLSRSEASSLFRAVRSQADASIRRLL